MKSNNEPKNPNYELECQKRSKHKKTYKIGLKQQKHKKHKKEVISKPI